MKSIPTQQHAHTRIPSLQVCLEKQPGKVLEYLAAYDDQVEVSKNAQTQVITFNELGKVSSILLRLRFRQLLAEHSDSEFTQISSYVKTNFWLAYEKDELYSKINDKILTTPLFKKKYDIEKFLRIRDLPFQEVSKEDRDFRDSVKSILYSYKKRMFQSIFRKTPDQHQNVALLLRIFQTCKMLEKVLISAKKTVSTCADSALRKTWHMNSLKYPGLSKLQTDWKRWLQNMSLEPKWKWHVSNYQKDIYGWHIPRDEIWPKIVQQLEKENYAEYVQLLQLTDTRLPSQTRIDSFLQRAHTANGNTVDNEYEH